jgi:hypothetical protein
VNHQVSEGLRGLNRVARVLRARRSEQGALSLASPEVRFELDTETHDPLDVGVYQVRRRVGRHAVEPHCLSWRWALLCVLVPSALVVSLAPLIVQMGVSGVVGSRGKPNGGGDDAARKHQCCSGVLRPPLSCAGKAPPFWMSMAAAQLTCCFVQAILAAYPACALLRRHPTPPPRQFEPLLAAASAAGFTLDVSTSRVT